MYVASSSRLYVIFVSFLHEFCLSTLRFKRCRLYFKHRSLTRIHLLLSPSASTKLKSLFSTCFLNSLCRFHTQSVATFNWLVRIDDAFILLTAYQNVTVIYLDLLDLQLDTLHFWGYNLFLIPAGILLTQYTYLSFTSVPSSRKVIHPRCVLNIITSINYA